MHNAKSFFIHVGMLIALTVTLSYVLVLSFAVINIWFPDVLGDGMYYSVQSVFDTVRLAVATLIISFPVYVILAWLSFVQVRQEQGAQVLPLYPVVGLSKWVMYVIAFATVTTGLLTLSTIVYTFLGGEITSRFLLKSAVLLTVIGLTSIYYFQALRFGTSRAKVKMHAYVLCALVITSIVLGFVVIGSPMKQRDIQFDERRSTALLSIQTAVDSFYQDQGRLPTSLEEMIQSPRAYYFETPFDPETSEPFEYAVTAQYTYQLCATFALDSAAAKRPQRGIGYMSNEQYFKHGEGRQCFTRQVLPLKTAPVMPVQNEVRP